MIKDSPNKETKIEKKTQVKNDSPMEKFLNFLDSVHLGEKTYNSLIHKIFNVIKVFIVSTRKFIIDDCFTKASSIAYTVIVSLIPTLTVILTYYAGSKKDEIFFETKKFMDEHNLKFINPVLEAIDGLIDNAASIRGIGVVVLFFTATAMLRSLEKSFNSIWKVQKKRPLYLKIVYYWAAITLGPAMLVAGTAVAAKVTEMLSSPNYYSAQITDQNKTWIVGSKSNIFYFDKDMNKQIDIEIDSIDFDNQKLYKFNKTSKIFEEDSTAIRIKAITFKRNVYNDIQFINNNGWIVGNDGIILMTKNYGKTWQLKKFGSNQFNDIHMISINKGFIAANNGNIFSTTDGGKSWQRTEWEGVHYNFNSISFSSNTGIATGNSGVIAITTNLGTNWEIKEIKVATKKDKYIKLKSAYFIDQNNIWIVGTGGIILKSKNNGVSWERIKLNELFDYYSVFFTDPQTGFITGDNGTIFKTSDAGKKWEKTKLPGDVINKLLFKNNMIWAIGENGLLMHSSDKGKTWSGISGRNFLMLLINFLAPFVFIWLVFMLAYKTLPNIRVPFKEASIGAAFTGTVWVMFILLFIIYIEAFADSTFRIYGALASIPLFLLMVYASSLIILYGAEVAYTLMHPETYASLKKAFLETEDIHVYYGIYLIHHIYKKFEMGKGATHVKELSKLGIFRTEQIEYFTTLFEKEKLLLQNDTDEYIPANNSKNIKISELVEIIHHLSLDIPVSAKNNELKTYLKNIFADLKENRNNIIGKKTLQDLINNS